MKFLIDAQLPRKMRSWFSDAGVDALHTLDMPTGNRSTDEQIRLPRSGKTIAGQGTYASCSASVPAWMVDVLMTVAWLPVSWLWRPFRAY